MNSAHFFLADFSTLKLSVEFLGNVESHSLHLLSLHVQSFKLCALFLPLLMPSQGMSTFQYWPHLKTFLFHKSFPDVVWQADYIFVDLVMASCYFSHVKNFLIDWLIDCFIDLSLCQSSVALWISIIFRFFSLQSSTSVSVCCVLGIHWASWPSTLLFSAVFLISFWTYVKYLHIVSYLLPVYLYLFVRLSLSLSLSLSVCSSLSV